MPKQDHDFREFEEKFAKLVTNREKVPLELLETRYKAAYGRLCRWLSDFADWYIDEAVRTFVKNLWTAPEDTVGAEDLRRKAEAIRAEEKRPGGTYEATRRALLLELDKEAAESGALRICGRISREAYAPYVGRFNRTVGILHRPHIYNSLFKAFWFPRTDIPEGGFWVNVWREVVMVGYPPELPRGTEKTKGEKT